MNKPSSYIKYMPGIQARPEKQVIRELVWWILHTLVTKRHLKKVRMLGMPGNEAREIFYLVKLFNLHLPTVALNYTGVEILKKHCVEIESRIAPW